jgi:hypothetical protein
MIFVPCRRVKGVHNYSSHLPLGFFGDQAQCMNAAGPVLLLCRRLRR